MVMNALQNSIYSESIRRELRARQRWYATHGKNLRIPTEAQNQYGQVTSPKNKQDGSGSVPPLNFAMIPHPPNSLPVQLPLNYPVPVPPNQLNTVPMTWRAPRAQPNHHTSNNGSYSARVVTQDDINQLTVHGNINPKPDNRAVFSRSAPLSSSSSSSSSDSSSSSFTVPSTPPTLTVSSLPLIPVNPDVSLHSHVPLPHDHAMYQKSVRTHTPQVSPFDEAEQYGYLTMNLPTHLYKPPSIALASPVVVTNRKGGNNANNNNANNNANANGLWPTPPTTVRVPVELVRYIPLDDRDKDGEKGHFLAKSLGFGPNHRNYYRYIRDNREGKADVALFRANHVN